MTVTSQVYTGPNDGFDEFMLMLGKMTGDNALPQSVLIRLAKNEMAIELAGREHSKRFAYARIPSSQLFCLDHIRDAKDWRDLLSIAAGQWIDGVSEAVAERNKQKLRLYHFPDALLEASKADDDEEA